MNECQPLMSGQGVLVKEDPSNPVQAVFWLRKASYLGDADAQALLGTVLLSGNALAGVEKDAARAVALFTEAGEDYFLGMCYLEAGAYTRPLFSST